MSMPSTAGYAQLFINSILGITSQDPAPRQDIVSQLKTSGPYKATAFLAVSNQSTTFDTVSDGDQNGFDYFVAGASAAQNPLLQALANHDGIRGYHSVLSMPDFAYKAIGGEYSLVADTDVLVERFCAVGANNLYLRDTGRLRRRPTDRRVRLRF